jgi:hypothetical protein
MKFTSIVFAALVAATQFSSTFAQPKNYAKATPASTYMGTAVTIDVSGTDEVDDGGSSKKSVAAALLAKEMTLYAIAAGDVTSPTDGGTVTVVKGATDDKPDQLKYTPKDGFTGTATFTYTFDVGIKSLGSVSQHGSNIKKSVMATVTVTVKPTPIKQTFEIPGQVSSGNAVKYTQAGLFNTVASIPGAPDADSFTAIVKPVFGNSADFAANTSTEVVKQNFNTLFLNFYDFFRGGN